MAVPFQQQQHRGDNSWMGLPAPPPNSTPPRNTAATSLTNADSEGRGTGLLTSYSVPSLAAPALAPLQQPASAYVFVLL